MDHDLKRFALYAINKFFVEVDYDILNTCIVNKVCFKSGEKLDRYSNFLDDLFPDLLS